MKLKQITGSAQQKAKSAPTIALGYFNGRVYFNTSTVNLLDLKEGDSLAFYQDEDSPKDWYFTKSKVEGSHKLKFQQKALCFFSCGIARPILQTANQNESASFFIDEEKVDGKYWRILTNKAIK